MTASWIRGRSGQSTVEVVALLPVLLAVALALLCGLAAGRAHERAAQAAGAGAIALLQAGDAEQAARAAAPDVRRRDLEVVVREDRVRVSVTPRLPLPGLADRLAATATAHTGRRPEA